MSALLGFYVVVILSLFSWKTYSFQSFRHIGTFQHHVSKKVVQRNSNLNALGPSSAFVLGSRHLVKEATLIFNSFGASKVKQDDELPGKYGLSLSNNAVKAVEQSRLVRSGPVKAHPIARYIYEIGCNVLDAFFDNRPISRFWFLETIARVPYFAYTSMLHFYESVGWWRQASLRRVHDAEEWNELHHLLIMENLGGDKVWFDRWLGQLCAVGYYWAIVALFFFSPNIAYQFMELLESHAVDTYEAFLLENADRLKTISAPQVAKEYYTGSDLSRFDDFQVNTPPGCRRPSCDSLYDVFRNIRDDEKEHVSTMKACQEYSLDDSKPVISPHTRFATKVPSNDLAKNDDTIK